MAEMSKGAKMLQEMVLKRLGITPEMLANPALLLQQFGINPDDVLKPFAELRQISLRIEAAFLRNEEIGLKNAADLGAIKRHLGIVTGHGGGVDGDDGGKLRILDQRPPHRRN